MKRALFFVLCIHYALLIFSQNLVVNPGFESWSKINKPASWAHAENCQKDSLTLLSGSYSCFHSGGESTSSDLGQTIAVIPGSEYELSFSYKTSGSTTGNGARIWSYWKNADGSIVFDPMTDDILRPSKYMKSETWKRVTLYLNAPATAASLYLEVRTYPGSGCWWDDFYFGLRQLTAVSERVFIDPKVYPVPVRNILHIENSFPDFSVEILDMTGRKITGKEIKGSLHAEFSFTGYPSGYYFIRIRSSGKTYIRKIIRQGD
jgi:hypothetical protein